MSLENSSTKLRSSNLKSIQIESHLYQNAKNSAMARDLHRLA